MTRIPSKTIIIPIIQLISITYKVQEEANGLAEAFIIGEEFIGKDNVAMILGDNIFYGNQLEKCIKEANRSNDNIIFGYPVSDPERYGFVDFFELPEDPITASELIGIQKTFNNLVRLVVLTNKNNRESFVTMVHYNQAPDKVIETLKKGDNVCIIGCVQTTKKENNGEIHHFENYVANEISKL